MDDGRRAGRMVRERRDVTDSPVTAREQQCAHRVVGKPIHHRVPGCGMTWTAFQRGVWSGEIEVFPREPADSRRCSRCYSDASYERHPL